ncbi:MAG: virulence factor SrfB [Verrucomicrobiota bacterium]
MPLILKVFPNTGHHFFTRPLGELLPQRKEHELVKLVQQSPRQFMPWSKAYPWLRFRLGTDAENKPIISIAVESNLGHWLRGTLYDVQSCEPDPMYDNVFPYAREHIVHPMAGHTEEIRSLALGDPASPSILDVDLKVHFKGSAGGHVDVDLVVDLGNTRTAAVLLESGRTPLSDRVRALKISPRGTELTGVGPRVGLPRSLNWIAGDQNDLAIIDSWLLLHQSLFAHLEPGECLSFVVRNADEYDFEQTGQKGWLMECSVPHVFVELSPALVGGGKSVEGAARIFSGTQLDWDYRFYLSSPKRYVWSLAQQGHPSVPGSTIWFQIPNQPDPSGTNVFVPLMGLIRYFMSTDGKDLNTEETESDVLGLKLVQPKDPAKFQPFVYRAAPTYSYSDAVCWFAMSLLEAAYRQINSEAYLAGLKGSILPRRLRCVRVTCPAGWTFQERELYFRQWQRAINLFAMTRFEDCWEAVDRGGSQPLLCRENLDEAVCSQLPILYAEIQSFANQAAKWIELYGTERSVVVMNLDIGGGTTDLAIIKYINEDPHGAILRPKLLFRDGYPVAGDIVVKKIIEQVLIPIWFKSSNGRQNPALAEARSHLQTLFRQPRHPHIREIRDGGATASKRLARVIRLLFIPLANLLLQALCERPAQTTSGDPLRRQHGGLDGCHPLNIRECIAAQIIDASTLDDLNQLCCKVIQHYFPQAGWSAQDKVFSDQAVLNCSVAAVEQCIDDVFLSLFTGLSNLVARHNCQLLIVSGKPSELPRVRDLLVQTFPLLPQRIIQVKNYPAGEWYPFATVGEGRIMDAKTCTVVGAALYQDIRNRNTTGFTVIIEDPDEFQKNAYWGIIPKGGSTGGFFEPVNIIFNPNDYIGAMSDPNHPDRLVLESRPLKVNLAGPLWIGRQLVKDEHVQPAPVYRLNWNPPASTHPPEVAWAEVSFRWVSIRGKGDMLEPVRVTPLTAGQVINMRDVRLELNTLMEEEGEFWLDNPRLDVTLAGASLASGSVAHRV